MMGLKNRVCIINQTDLLTYKMFLDKIFNSRLATVVHTVYE